MKRLKNFNLRFDRIKIWSIHIKTKCLTGVIGDSRWLKYHPNITQRSPGYTDSKTDTKEKMVLNFAQNNKTPGLLNAQFNFKAG